MKIGIQELLVVFIVALVVVGPDKLPYYAKKLGQALGQFRKYTEEATRDIRESVVEPLNEAQKPLREAMAPVTELEKDVQKNVDEIKKSISDIGKPVKDGNTKNAEAADAPREGNPTDMNDRPQEDNPVEMDDTPQKDSLSEKNADLREERSVSETTVFSSNPLPENEQA